MQPKGPLAHEPAAHACRVELRKAYIKRSHEFAATLQRGEKGLRNERTPDDAMRYQSVMFALAKALDKARVSLVSHLLSLSCKLYCS